MKKFVFITLAILSLNIASAQSIQDVEDEPMSNPRYDRPLGIKGMIGGYQVIPAIGLEYYVLPDLKIEYDFGTSLQMAGVQYHILGNRDKFATPYVGAMYLVLEDQDRGTTNDGFYFPFGFQYMSPGGWLFAAEIGPLTHKNINSNPIFLGVIVAYHFKGLQWRK